MTEVFVITGEHPFDPYYPLEVFASETSANIRAAELTRDFLQAFWEIEFDDEPLLKMPEVTPTNWRELNLKYGEGGPSNNWEQDDRFGSWWVDVSDYEVKP